jgi:hypothetical protein
MTIVLSYYFCFNDLGYQSHFILTNIQGDPAYYEEDCYNEFAIDQENQV